MAISPSLRSALAPRYELLEEIGQGGMATVYRAIDCDSGSEVAVKVLDPELASALDPTRFEREIRIASELRHPSILPLLGSGELGGYLHYAMPFIRGESLRQRLDREGQLGVEETLSLIAPLAEALDYAHELRVVHRDVNPANVLVSESGDVFLVDFGIARMLTQPGGDKVTATGHTVGTPAYSSPEQSESGRAVDGRADIYSLGCVVHEMLAGQPPFLGKTAQVVMAQHLAAPPPSLGAIRPGLPPALVAAVQKALAKVPADRYATGAALLTAMTAPQPPTSVAVKRTRATAAALLVAAIVVYSVGDWGSSVPLDPNKVLVFPLAATSAVQDPSAGWDAALAIGAALEHVEPLRFIDARSWLSEDLRTDPSGVTADVARTLSYAHGAAFYISGAIRTAGGAASVIVRLYDVAGDSLVVQESADTAPDRLAVGALDAILRVLPRLVDPGRPMDLSPLTERAPAATALFLQGERAYRQSRFEEAVDLYQRALAEDPLYAFAAIKGASAADWAAQFDDAQALVETALVSQTVLPAKYQAYAEGLDAYFDGNAERARDNLEVAVGLDAEWPEAASALAEVYYHLLPADAVHSDSLANHWLKIAWEADSTFAPPLYHLSEIALRKGDIAESARLLERWRPFEPDTIYLRQLELSIDCLRGTPADFDWTRQLTDHPRPVLMAGTALARGARQSECASGALRAIFESDLPATTWRGRALMGLQGLALAQGRYEDARELLRDGIDGGIAFAHMYYTYAAVAGAPFEEEADAAEQIVRDAFGDVYSRASAELAWLMGLWLASRGDLVRASAVAAALSERAEQTDALDDVRLARSLRAHLLVAEGNATEAIQLLEGLVPDAPRNPLIQGLWEPMGLDRLLLAELQLGQGRHDDAYRTASLLDQSAPLSYLPLLPRSLAVRVHAASAMDRQDREVESLTRLNELGWSSHELVPRPPLSKE